MRRSRRSAAGGARGSRKAEAGRGAGAADASGGNPVLASDYWNYELARTGAGDLVLSVFVSTGPATYLTDYTLRRKDVAEYDRRSPAGRNSFLNSLADHVRRHSRN